MYDIIYILYVGEAKKEYTMISVVFIATYESVFIEG